MLLRQGPRPTGVSSDGLIEVNVAHSSRRWPSPGPKTTMPGAKAARLAQAGQHHATEDQEVVPPVSHVSMPVCAKPIRISLDLAPMLFDQLTLWRTQAAVSWVGGE